MNKAKRFLAVLLSFAMVITSLCFTIGAAESRASVGTKYTLSKDTGYGTKTKLGQFSLLTYEGPFSTAWSEEGVSQYKALTKLLEKTEWPVEGGKSYFADGEDASAKPSFYLHKSGHPLISAHGLKTNIIAFTAPECGRYEWTFTCSLWWDNDVPVHFYKSGEILLTDKFETKDAKTIKASVSLGKGETAYLAVNFSAEVDDNVVMTFGGCTVEYKAEGHAFEITDIEKEATYDEDGYGKYACYCGETKEDVIPKVEFKETVYSLKESGFGKTADLGNFSLWSYYDADNMIPDFLSAIDNLIPLDKLALKDGEDDPYPQGYQYYNENEAVPPSQAHFSDNKNGTIDAISKEHYLEIVKFTAADCGEYVLDLDAYGWWNSDTCADVYLNKTHIDNLGFAKEETKNSIELTMSKGDEIYIVFRLRPSCTGYDPTRISNLTVTQKTHAHNWDVKEVITPNSCTQDGESVFVCPCGREETKKVSADHDYIIDTTPATYFKDGLTVTTCSRCDYRKEEILPMLQASVNDRFILSECGFGKTSDLGLFGLYVYEGDVENAIANPADYKKLSVLKNEGYYTEDDAELSNRENFFLVGNDVCVNASSITKTQIVSFTAPLCGAYSIALNAHGWDNTAEATIVKGGEIATKGTIAHNVGTDFNTTIDTACGENVYILFSGYSSATINKLTVTFSEAKHTAWDEGVDVKPATCESIGERVYTCACGATRTEYIPASHNWDDGEITSAATCSINGYKTYTCKTCNTHKYEIIPTRGHSYTSEIVPPGCITHGYTKRTCSNCGYITYSSKKNPKNHKFVGGVCSVCGTNESDPAHNHSYTDTVVTAECGNPGYTIHTCECGDLYTDGMNSVSHKWGASVTVQKSNCVVQGFATAECELCGGTKPTVLPLSDNHAWDAGTVTKEPTCFDQGSKHFVCGLCAQTKDEVIEALGHSYKDGKCEGCGMPEFKPGLPLDATEDVGFGTKLDLGLFRLYTYAGGWDEAVKNISALAPMTKLLDKTEWPVNGGKGYFTETESVEDAAHFFTTDGSNMNAMVVKGKTQIIEITSTMCGTYSVKVVAKGWATGTEAEITIIQNGRPVRVATVSGTTGGSAIVTLDIAEGQKVYVMISGKGTEAAPVEITDLIVTARELGHIWDNGVVQSEKSETTDGVVVYSCGCGEQIVEVDHAFASLVDNEDGNTHKGFCNACQKEIEEEHKYTSEVIEPATSEKEGTEKLTCACGYVTERKIPKLLAVGTVWNFNAANGFGTETVIAKQFTLYTAKASSIEGALNDLVLLDKIEKSDRWPEGNRYYGTYEKYDVNNEYWHFIKMNSGTQLVQCIPGEYNIIRFTAPATGTYSYYINGQGLWNNDTVLTVYAKGEQYNRVEQGAGKTITEGYIALKAGEYVDFIWNYRWDSSYDPAVLNEFKITYIDEREFCKVHTWDEGTVVVPLTCEQDGITHFVCTVCGYEMDELYEHQGHKFAAGTVFTDTGDGKNHTAICSVCNQPATAPHEFEVLEVLVEPTYTKTGTEKVRCTDCGLETTRSISKLVRPGTEYVVSVDKGFGKKVTFGNFSFYTGQGNTLSDQMANLVQLEKLINNNTWPAGAKYYTAAEAKKEDKDNHFVYWNENNANRMLAFAQYQQATVIRFVAPCDGTYKYNFEGSAWWSKGLIEVSIYTGGKQYNKMLVELSNSRITGRVYARKGETIDLVFRLSTGSSYDIANITKYSLTYLSLDDTTSNTKDEFNTNFDPAKTAGSANPKYETTGDDAPLNSATVGRPFYVEGFGESYPMQQFTFYTSKAENIDLANKYLTPLDQLVYSDRWPQGMRYMTKAEAKAGNTSTSEHHFLQYGGLAGIGKASTYDVIRFTAPATGTYSFCISMSGEWSSDVIGFKMYKNGTTDMGVDVSIPKEGRTATGQVYLKKGQYVNIIIRLIVGSTYDIYRVNSLNFRYESTSSLKDKVKVTDGAINEVREIVPPEGAVTYDLSGFGDPAKMGPLSMFYSTAADATKVSKSLKPLLKTEYVYFPDMGYKYSSGFNDGNRNFIKTDTTLNFYAEKDVYNVISFKAPADGQVLYIMSGTTETGNNVEIMVTYEGKWYSSLLPQQHDSIASSYIDVKAGENVYFITRLTLGTFFNTANISDFRVMFIEGEEGSKEPAPTEVTNVYSAVASLGLAFMN